MEVFPDDDGDGIVDSLEPVDQSVDDVFEDAAAGGTTRGRIFDRGDRFLFFIVFDGYWRPRA